MRPQQSLRFVASRACPCQELEPGFEQCAVDAERVQRGLALVICRIGRFCYQCDQNMMTSSAEIDANLLTSREGKMFVLTRMLLEV
jgi:hypothetical protein